MLLFSSLKNTCAGVLADFFVLLVELCFLANIQLLCIISSLDTLNCNYSSASV